MINPNPIVTIEFENYNPMIIELYPEVAPNTVKNYIALVQKNYYNGSIFHRVIEGFMIQGGAGNGSTCKVVGEFKKNGYPNNLEHQRGVISMARTSDPNSATSQFFIVHKDSPHLNGLYASFGMMIDGFDTLDQIASVETNTGDKPLVDVIMKSISVDLKGVEYSKPLCK
ncbi:MAG: peptidylprolyl isomerase [Firmicutes bacterium]|nr:peptidylprolyl isomerase [Bacillota bacterium]